jgi:hypothetical protein
MLMVTSLGLFDGSPVKETRLWGEFGKGSGLTEIGPVEFALLFARMI